jgi:hypothetical protein
VKGDFVAQTMGSCAFTLQPPRPSRAPHYRSARKPYRRAGRTEHGGMVRVQTLSSKHIERPPAKTTGPLRYGIAVHSESD